MTRFLGLLDTPGGHMLICLALIAGGVACAAFGLDVSKDVLVIFALGVLAKAMMGQNGKGAQ